METVTWCGLQRLLRLALMGVGAAFAAVAVSVLLGLGAGSAHAADDEAPGLLGALTGVLGDTTSLVGSTVAGVTSVATDAVTTVVSVAPAPVQQPVAAVVETVGSTVGAVVAPVERVVSSEVVGSVAEPVVALVTAVPVVGRLVSGIGLDTALTDIAADLDDALSTVIRALADTGTALAPPSTAPESETAIGPRTTDAAIPGVLPAPSALGVGAERAASVVPRLSAPVAPATMLATAGVAAADGRELDLPTGVLCPPSPLSSGPAGAGSGAWALAALLPFVAHRAWVRRAGPEDELSPPAPAGSTDVSPD